jgi:RNA polymerase sporulation-specific sigma factor
LQHVSEAQKSNQESIDQLVEEYSRFVYQIGKKFFLPGATKEDLIQEGMIGLFNAILNYDPEYKTSFDDYASLSIRNRILRAVRMATQLKQKVLSEAYSLDEDPFYYASMFAETNVEEQVLGKMSMNELSRSFKQILSPMEYDIISLKISDASVDEMALKFDLSKKQVENALFRARRKISILLKNEVELRKESYDKEIRFIEEELQIDEPKELLPDIQTIG